MHQSLQNTHHSKVISPKKKSTLQKWFPMFIIALSLAIIVIDGTVLNVSQTAVIEDLGTDLKTIQWAFTSYSLVLAALTIFGGRLGDIFGRLKMFRLGAILFAVGSFLTTVAPNVGILLFGWSVVEGVGAALMTPAASALIVSNYQGRDRGTAFAIFGATAGGASAFGPIIGGFLARYGSNISQFLSSVFSSIPTISDYFANFSGWRWAFGINVIVVSILMLGSKAIKENFVKSSHKIYLDMTGVVLSSFGLIAVVYGLIESSTYGWFQTTKPYEVFGQSFDLAGISISLYAIVIGIIFLATYVWWEFRVEKEGKEPMIRLEIFNNATFTFGILTLTTLFAGFTGIITYGIVLYYLTVLNLDSLSAGLGLIPFSIMTFVMAPISAKLAQRFGGKIIVQIGLVLILIGCGMYYIAFKDGATVWTFVPGSLVFGTGFGLMVAQINNLVLSAVDTKLAGVASGINGTIREVGRTFGVALIGAAFISSLGTHLKTNLENNLSINTEAKQEIIKSIDSGEVNVSSNESLTDKQVFQKGYQTGAIYAIENKAQESGIVLNSTSAQNIFLENYRKNESQIKIEVNKSITESSKNSILFTAGFGILAFGFSFGIGNDSKKKKIS